MKKLIAKRYIIRQNLLAIIGFCLFFYFSYHLVLGERSYVRYMTLDRQVTKVSQKYDALNKTRTALEEKVVRLRPDTLDKDVLEERARYLLGYNYPDEKIILLNK